MVYRKDKWRKSDSEWWHRYRFKQEVDICGDYDDNDEPKMYQSRVYTGEKEEVPEYSKHSKVVVRRYDKDGKIIEEITEIYHYLDNGNLDKIEKQEVKKNG